METQETTNNEEVTIEDPKAVLAALERAKGDAKKLREEKDELFRLIEEKNETLAKYSGSLINEKISKKIGEEGIRDPERLLKFINMNEITIDDNFDIVGLDEQIESLKAELPEIFDAKLRVGGQADTAVKASVSTQYSASQIQAMKVLGKF